jgi:hypothetical protein
MDRPAWRDIGSDADAFGELADMADPLVDVTDSPVDVTDSPVHVADSPVHVADSGEETGWANARSSRPGVHAVACSST